MLDWHSYKKYKRLTDRILAWAQTTALEIEEASLLPGSPHSRGRRRRRRRGGRGRRGRHLATSAAATITPNGFDLDSQRPSKFPFKFAQFLVYIETIASSDVPVNRKMLTTMHRNIVLRKKVAAFYVFDTSVEEKNRSHQHAIGVFEKAFAVLREGVRRREKEKTQAFFVDAIRFGYYFEDEEDEDEDEQTAQVLYPGSTKSGYGFEEDEEDEEEKEDDEEDEEEEYETDEDEEDEEDEDEAEAEAETDEEDEEDEEEEAPVEDPLELYHLLLRLAIEKRKKADPWAFASRPLSW